MPTEHFTRRNLPHWFMPSATHFITFRLAGTLPVHVLADFQERKDRLLRAARGARTAALHREHVHKQLFAAYDDYLDNNREVHWLDDPSVAALVRRSLYHWNNQKYGLCAYCILPNHVHVLFRPFGELDVEADRESIEPGERADAGNPLSEIMHSLKSYTAHEANKLLGREGSFWQHESYDHWVRDEDELERIVAYINANPVKAGLAETSWQFVWSSAHDRYLKDGSASGWLEGTT